MKWFERMGVAAILLHLVAAIFAQGAAAQGARTELPQEVAGELIEFYNRQETIRMAGGGRIAPASGIVGDVAVLGGPFIVAGHIHGRVVVINGDVHLEPGSSITGDLTVVGGIVKGLDAAQVTGTVIAYRAPLRYRDDGGRLVAVAPETELELSTGREFNFGRTDLTVAAQRGYNRVEGLPIAVGPRFESRGADPFMAQALVVYRTESGLGIDPDELGYRVRVEKSFGSRAFRLGVMLRSEIEPIEAHGLSDRENSLATFLLHRDYRDHYDRTGWSAFLRFEPRDRPYEIGVEYRDERHTSVATGDPWTLPGVDGDWRLQPLVAEGTLRTLAARFRFDTRNEGANPSDGWLVDAVVERGLGGSLRYPIAWDEPAPSQALDQFATATVDARRYARLSPTSRIALRALASGSLNDRPLPPQRQHALGGEGTLPGYATFRFDCGARHATVTAEGQAFFPYYGCDRLALVQLEYLNDLPFGRGLGRKLGRDMDLGETPAWVIFFDAGRAWNEREARDGRTAGQDDFAVDVGAGLRLGRLGIYWALPLSGRDQGINFFVRYGSRL